MELHYEKIDGSKGSIKMDKDGKICLGQKFMYQDGDYVETSGKVSLMSN